MARGACRAVRTCSQPCIHCVGANLVHPYSNAIVENYQTPKFSLMQMLHTHCTGAYCLRSSSACCNSVLHVLDVHHATSGSLANAERPARCRFHATLFHKADTGMMEPLVSACIFNRLHHLVEATDNTCVSRRTVPSSDCGTCIMNRIFSQQDRLALRHASICTRFFCTE